MALSATLLTIRNNCMNKISLATGTSANTYSIPKIDQLIQTLFDTIFDRRFWDRHCYWETKTLDGVTGKPTVIPSTLVRFQDIKVMYRDNGNHPLPYADDMSNPSKYTGTIPKVYRSTNDTSIFQILPLTSIGTITYKYRRKPADFTQSSDIVPFDSESMALGVTWLYLDDKGINPVQAENYRNIFETRIKQLEDMESTGIIALKDSVTEIPNEWA